MAAVYSLFIDDEREPPLGRAPAGIWIICRSVATARNVVEHWGMPRHVSFDHDLGDGPTGLDFAKWLVERDLDGFRRFPKGFTYAVHSMNPVGAANIEGLMSGYLRARAA